MYGWINDCVEKLVIEKFGLEAWAKIKADAGIDVENGGWIRQEHYGDDLTIKLVGAAAAALNVGADVVLELFGQYFINFVRLQGFESILRIQGSSLREWLSNINELHKYLAINLPMLVPPEFWCTEDPDDPEVIILRYYSSRGNSLAPLVVGVVKEVAQFYFRITVNMDQTATQDVDNSKFTIWRITKTSNLPAPATIANANDIDRLLTANVAGFINPRDSSKLNHALPSRCPFSSGAASPDTSSSPPASVGMTPAQMCSIFPYHIVIDQDFRVLQQGSKLQEVFAIELGSSISSYFTISTPPMCPWDWSSLLLTVNSTIVIDTIASTPLNRANSANIVLWSLRGSIQAPTSSTGTFTCILLLNPNISNIEQLIKSGLTLSDVQGFNLQKDLILLGEHLACETENAYKNDILSRQLEKERQLSVRLLNQMLPPKVTEELRAGRQVLPENFDNVTIFFSDIVGFTRMSAMMKPIEIVDMLNQLYTVMDHVTAKFGLYKVETIGDAYMVVGGLPTSDPEHALKVANFALCVRRAVSIIKCPLDDEPIKIRIGIHSGNVVAGVVGNLMPRYCLFGDTVNTASRMESTGEAMKIHCSGSLEQLIGPSGLFVLSERGTIPVKGKGDLLTYWLEEAASKNLSANESAQEALVSSANELYLEAISNRPIYTGIAEGGTP